MGKVRLAMLAACSLAMPALLWADATNCSHIECFKFKDNIPKATYTANQSGESGCIIKVPAKLVCVCTFKSGVSPTPPGGGPDLDLNEQIFFCYKEKCPKITIATTLKDQFGTHNIGLQTTSSKLLCAPASPSGAFLDDASAF